MWTTHENLKIFSRWQWLIKHFISKKQYHRARGEDTENSEKFSLLFVLKNHGNSQIDFEQGEGEEK